MGWDGLEWAGMGWFGSVSGVGEGARRWAEAGTKRKMRNENENGSADVKMKAKRGAGQQTARNKIALQL